MKQNLLTIVFNLIAFFTLCYGEAAAQTYFQPFSTSTNSENVSLSFSDGSTFNGVKKTTITNGQVINVHYLGTFRYATGERILTENWGSGFDANFHFNNGNFYYINNDGEMYHWYFNNGQRTESRDYRQYSIDGNFIVIYTDSYGGGYASPSYNGGSYNGGSSSGSNYDSHKATCRGCNGGGKCQHCRGLGYVNNYNTKCSLCHGTGRCVSCNGQGYIRGNF